MSRDEDEPALSYASRVRDELAQYDAEAQQLLGEIDMALSMQNPAVVASSLRQLKRRYLAASELIGRYLGASARGG